MATTTLQLNVTARSKQKPHHIRTAGNVPCVVYGNNVTNQPLEVGHKEILGAFTKAGYSSIVELSIDGKAVPVLFHDINFDPVTDRVTHADFYAVDMKKELTADVPLRLVGESPAVKDMAAVLMTPIDSVEVKCLPADLPHDIEVDISVLKAFHDSIHVSDLKLPAKVKMVTDADVLVVMAQEPRALEVVQPVVTAEAAAGAVVPGAEGAAAAPGAAAAAAPAKEEKKK